MAWSFWRPEAPVRDALRDAFRQLARRPGISMGAIASLALGFGADAERRRTGRPGPTR
jgi:hypothetical protein